MTVSSILSIESSLDEDVGGSIATIGSTNSSAVESPDVGGLDALVEDSTLERLELAFIGAVLCRRKVAPMGAII